MPSIPHFANFIKPNKKIDRRKNTYLSTFFNSWILYYLFERIHKEFIIKSTGSRDSQGTKWKPLSESRRLYKPIRRGELSSAQRRMLRSGKTKKEALSDRDPPINIDTGRLLKSLKPGRVLSGKYVSNNPDQAVSVTSKGFKFVIKVPYADEVQDVRPFLPQDYGPWIQDAIQLALPKLRLEMKKHALI